MDDKQIILYGKKMFRITVDSADGDKINIQLPVAAVKRLLENSGKLPIPDGNLNGIQFEEIMSALMRLTEQKSASLWTNRDL